MQSTSSSSTTKSIDKNLVNQLMNTDIGVLNSIGGGIIDGEDIGISDDATDEQKRDFIIKNYDRILEHSSSFKNLGVNYAPPATNADLKPSQQFELSISKIQVKPQYVYQQYRVEQPIIDFFKLLDEYKQENYYNRIEEFINARDILHSNSEYITFYTRYLLGIYKPLGSASISNYWDVGSTYDEDVIANKPIVYDDSLVYDGTINHAQYITYLRFICNYEYEICNIDYVCRFVAAWCNIEVNDIYLNYGPGPKIKVELPNVANCLDFVKLTINYGDVMGWPKGVDLDFRIQTIYSHKNGNVTSYTADKHS